MAWLCNFIYQFVHIKFTTLHMFQIIGWHYCLKFFFIFFKSLSILRETKELR